MMQNGHVSLPNGMGVSYPPPWAAPPRDTVEGRHRRPGVALSSSPSATLVDKFWGTPWHKHVPGAGRTCSG